MFPSSGLLKNILCPCYKRGNCERKYCHFKHNSEKDGGTVKKKMEALPKPKSYIPITPVASYRPTPIKELNKLKKTPVTNSRIYIPTKIADSTNISNNLNSNATSACPTHKKHNESTYEPKKVPVKQVANLKNNSSINHHHPSDSNNNSNQQTEPLTNGHVETEINTEISNKSPPPTTTSKEPYKSIWESCIYDEFNFKQTDAELQDKEITIYKKVEIKPKPSNGLITKPVSKIVITDIVDLTEDSDNENEVIILDSDPSNNGKPPTDFSNIQNSFDRSPSQEFPLEPSASEEFALEPSACKELPPDDHFSKSEEFLSKTAIIQTNHQKEGDHNHKSSHKNHSVSADASKSTKDQHHKSNSLKKSSNHHHSKESSKRDRHHSSSSSTTSKNKDSSDKKDKSRDDKKPSSTNSRSKDRHKSSNSNSPTNHKPKSSTEHHSDSSKEKSHESSLSKNHSSSRKSSHSDKHSSTSGKSSSSKDHVKSSHDSKSNKDKNSSSHHSRSSSSHHSSSHNKSSSNHRSNHSSSKNNDGHSRSTKSAHHSSESTSGNHKKRHNSEETDSSKENPKKPHSKSKGKEEKVEANFDLFDAFEPSSSSNDSTICPALNLTNGSVKKIITKTREKLKISKGNIKNSELEECRNIFEEEDVRPDPGELKRKRSESEHEEPAVKKRIAHDPDLKREVKKVVPQRNMIYERVEKMEEIRKAHLIKTSESGLKKPFLGQIAKASPDRRRIGSISAPNMYLMKAISDKNKSGSERSLPSDLDPNITASMSCSKGVKRIAHVPLTPTKPRPIIPPNRSYKVPLYLRQKYLDRILTECFKFCSTEDEATKMGQKEESDAYDRSKNKVVYQNVAANIIAKLRKKAEEVSLGEPPQKFRRSVSHEQVLAGAQGQRVSYSLKKKNTVSRPDKLTEAEFYNHLKSYLMTEKQLEDNGYPKPDPSVPGKAIYPVKKSTTSYKANMRTCCRCQKEYPVDKDGMYVREDECTYHWGKLWKKRISGNIEARYSCCEMDGESDGCSYAAGHVHDNATESQMMGYVSTDNNPILNKAVYALDCEMGYTTAGIEIIRVTVINFNEKSVLEEFIKPENPILDCNTKFSGVKMSDLVNVKKELFHVQATLLSMFSSDSILIGHSLESDFKALKLHHNKVVDTSIVFPHRLGPPKKRALRNLMSEYLNKIIQNSVDEGHDSKEDAVACMQLMCKKVNEDVKRNGR